MRQQGLIYVFTGDGKGKTSAALGVAMRAVGHGKRVTMIQWYKERRWSIGEHALPKILKKSLFKIYPMGQGFYRLPTDHATLKGHRQAAQEALHLAKELLTSDSGFPLSRVARRSIQKDEDQSFVGSLNDRPTFREALGIQRSKKPDAQFPRKGNPSSPLFLLVMDEVINAVNDRLIDLIDLIDLISKRGQTHLILTGRGAPKKLIEAADLVTEMKNVKHPYEKGLKAVQGLDF